MKIQYGKYTLNAWDESVNHINEGTFWLDYYSCNFDETANNKYDTDVGNEVMK